MIKSSFSIIALLALSGCSFAVEMVKAPLDKGCKSQKINACPELLDGTIAFINEDKKLGLEKISTALEKNSPEQVKMFLDLIGGLPGLEGLVSSLANYNDPSVDKSNNSTVKSTVTANKSALKSVDKNVAFSVLSAGLTSQCKFWGQEYKCEKLDFKHSTMVTDVLLSKTCSQTFIISGTTDIQDGSKPLHSYSTKEYPLTINWVVDSQVTNVKWADRYRNIYVLSNESNCVVSVIGVEKETFDRVDGPGY